jgi:hypothetical protein
MGNKWLVSYVFLHILMTALTVNVITYVVDIYLFADFDYVILKNNKNQMYLLCVTLDCTNNSDG